MRKRALFILLISVSMSLAFLFTNIAVSNAHTTTDTMDTIMSRGYIIVGSDTTYPPFEYYNATTKITSGFDVDLANQIAKNMSVKLDFMTTDWTTIIPDLVNNSKFDMIISAMTITPERALQVDFTRWYYQSYQAVLVPAANPKGITSVNQLNVSGMRIGFQTGTTSHLYANESLQAAQATFHPYPDIATAIEDLKAGNLDAVLGDYAVLALDQAQSGQTKVVAKFSPENFGIAIRKNNPVLLAALNGVINSLLGSDQSNSQPSDLYNIMYYKWFNVNAPNYTGSVTTGVIPTVESTAPSTPGFELLTVFGVIAVIPIIKKYRK